MSKEREATPEEQEEFWQLHYALSVAEQNMREFDARHIGKSFRVFRPEGVMAMLNNDLEPLTFAGLGDA